MINVKTWTKITKKAEHYRPIAVTLNHSLKRIFAQLLISDILEKQVWNLESEEKMINKIVNDIWYIGE